MKRSTKIFLFTGIALLLFTAALGTALNGLGYFQFHRYTRSNLFFRGKVALVPLAGVSESEVQLMKTQIEAFYGFDVTVLDRQQMPGRAFYKPRNRYKAKLVLDYLNATNPDTYNKVIALTNADISTNVHGYSDWGVIGLAYLGKEACIVSTYRLGKAIVKKSTYQDRLTKAGLHEIGHTLGLPHCNETPSCFMNDARGKSKLLTRQKLLSVVTVKNLLHLQKAEGAYTYLFLLVLCTMIIADKVFK